MGIIGEGIDLLKLVDKGRNADLYKQLGEWIDKVTELQKANELLSGENVKLREQLRFKGAVTRIAGRSYVDGDDEEICSRCAEVDHVPVHLLDMVIDDRGRRATCPHCKTPRGNGRPTRRQEAETIAQNKNTNV